MNGPVQSNEQPGRFSGPLDLDDTTGRLLRSRDRPNRLLDVVADLNVLDIDRFEPAARRSRPRLVCVCDPLEKAAEESKSLHCLSMALGREPSARTTRRGPHVRHQFRGTSNGSRHDRAVAWPSRLRFACQDDAVVDEVLSAAVIDYVWGVPRKSWPTCRSESLREDQCALLPQIRAAEAVAEAVPLTWSSLPEAHGLVSAAVHARHPELTEEAVAALANAYCFGRK